MTLIDRRNFHLFQPLLYQVATGALSAGEIASPLRVLVRSQKNTRVMLAEATDLHASTRRLILADGEVEYDSLIVAPGSENHYFGHDEWGRFAPGLKSVEDAARIRAKVLYAFEAAEREPDPVVRRAWLTFVVVGAGATGVELAGALAEIARDALRGDFRTIHSEEAAILLLDAAPRVLNTFSETLSASAERQLVKLGVRPRTGVMVSQIDATGVTIATARGPEHIATHTVLWAAGVRPSAFGEIVARETGAQRDRAGRIRVQDDLSVAGHPEIFVIGDLALCEQNGRALPGVAPVAMQMGRHVARVIAARIAGRQTKPFRYRDKGMLAVIGRNAAVGTIGRVSVTGRIAWLAWLFVHLMYIAEAMNRVLVFLKWGYSFLTFNRGSRLITGEEKRT